MGNSKDGKVKTAITLAIIANIIWGFGNYFIELSFRYASVAVTLAYRFSLSFLLLVLLNHSVNVYPILLMLY